MDAALKRTLLPRRTAPRPVPTDVEARLNIDVVFTTVEATLMALKMAAELASRLSAHVTLVVPQVVPYPMPLESPPVPLEWNERRFRTLAEQSPVETAVQICLCRDRLEALKRTLAPSSIVVVGGRKHWWPTFENKLLRTLRQAGHEVILAEMQ